MFYDRVVNGGLTHDGDVRLLRHTAHCVVKTDSRGQRVTKEIPCPKCKTANKVRTPYCTKCAEPLTDPTAPCAMCGKFNRMGTRCCIHCGNRLR